MTTISTRDQHAIRDLVNEALDQTDHRPIGREDRNFVNHITNYVLLGRHYNRNFTHALLDWWWQEIFETIAATLQQLQGGLPDPCLVRLNELQELHGRRRISA